MRVLVLAALPAAGTLVVDPWGWSPYGPARWTAVVGVVLAGATVGLRERVALERRTLVAWAVWLGWVAVAAGLGEDGRLAWVGTPQRHFGALTWALCALTWAAGQSITDEDDLRVVAIGATAACGALGAWSVAELAGWEPVDLVGSGRLVGPLGNADYLGAAAILLVPVAVGVALGGCRSRGGRAAAWSAALLGYVALVGSGTRGAWVGAIVAAAVVGVAHRRSGRDRAGGGRRRRARAALAVAVACGATVGLAGATGTAGRVGATVEGSRPGDASRLAEWAVALRVVEHHPVTGVGPEGYRIAFGTAVDPGYERRYGQTALPDRAHDSLLDVATTTGLPGLASYLALLVSAGAMIRKALRTRRPTTVGLAAGVVAYAVGSLVLFPIAELEPVAWLLVGVVTAQVVAGAETVTVRPPRVLAPLAVVSVVAVGILGVRAVQADRAMRSALDTPVPRAAVLAGRSVHLAPGNIVLRLAAARIDAAAGTEPGVDDAIAQVDAAAEVSPRDPVVDLDRGLLEVQRATITGESADWSRALASLDVVRAAQPDNPAVWLPLGVADEGLGRTGAAMAAWRTAAALDPASPSPDIDLAVLLVRHDHPGQAARVARQALDLDPGNPTAEAIVRVAGGT